MATKSIGLTGRDFSTLSAWASYVNALALVAPEIAEVYSGGAVQDTTIVTVSGWTGANATNTVTLRAAAGNGFKDHATAASNPLRYDPSFGAALTNNTVYQNAGVYFFDGQYLTVDGLMIRSTGTSSGIGRFYSNASIQNCVLKSTSFGGLELGGANNTKTIRNCALFVVGGLSATGNGYLANIENCTIVKRGTSAGSAVGGSDSAIIVMKNTVIAGAYTSDTTVTSGATFSASCTNNATMAAAFSIANAGNGTPQFNIAIGTDIVNATEGSEDLRLVSTSTKLINTGAALSVPTDIFGTSRPQGASWDIGALEYVIAPSLSGGATLSDMMVSGAMASYEPSSLTGTVTLGGMIASGSMGVNPGVITSPVLKNNTGTILANVTDIVANIYNISTGALILRKTGLTSNGSGIVTITDAALAAGTTYVYELDLSASSQGRRLPTGVAA